MNLRQLIAQAANLNERLSEDFIAENTPAALSQARLESWCQLVADGDWAQFTAILQAQGIHDPQAAVSDGRWRDGAEPTWAQTLRAALTPNDTRNSIKKPLFLPFIHFARDQIHRQPQQQRLSARAHADLETHLLRRLQEIATPLLDLKFASFRAGRFSFAHEQKQLRQQFLQNLQLTELIADYPVFGRLLATLTQFWIDSSGEFLQRLEEDWQSIEQSFKTQNRQVIGVQTGLSDPHQGGRSVLILSFDSGLKLVYKPRDLGIDAAFFQFLDWLNPHCSQPFRLLQILQRKDHGWMEFATESPPQTAESRQRYAHRAGGLLALLHLLDGTDFQRENLITAAEQPLLIDLETLLQPSVAANSPWLGQARFSDSVLRCGFLPQWTLSQQQATDISASSKTPGLDVASFQAGFSEIYRLLMQQRPALLAADSPLNGFAQQRIRPIFQDTALYQRLLKKSLQARCLQSGLERSMQLQFLLRLPQPAALPRIKQEIAMLEQADIPYFAANSSSANLLEAEIFLQAPAAQMRHRLQQLSEADLHQQLGHIRSAFGLANAVVENPRPSILPKPASWEHKLLHQAQQIAAELRASAIHTRYGGITWAIPERLGQTEEFHLQPANAGLYNGVSGICLFFAALDKVTEQTAHRDLIWQALKPVQASLQDVPQRTAWARQLNLGLAAGIGSLIYACVQLSKLLQDASLLESAEQAANLFSAEKIAAEQNHDLLGGHAGAVLALLALYAATENPQHLRLAEQCAAPLLLAAPAMSGFGHGNAGIAYALLRLFQNKPNPHYLSAANNRIEAENRLFSAVHHNWAAFNSSLQQPIFWSSFCHGAAGIGLGRLAGLAVLDNPQIRADIAHAIISTQAYDMNHVDFLCCGHAGRLEFLWQAAQQLQDVDLANSVRDKAAQILQSQQARGDYLLFEEFAAPIDNPSLFKGRAGIGYQWLRLLHPAQIPSVLSFDA